MNDNNPAEWSKEETRRRVNSALATLGDAAKRLALAADDYCRVSSGGRRRGAACEVATDRVFGASLEVADLCEGLSQTIVDFGIEREAAIVMVAGYMRGYTEAMRDAPFPVASAAPAAHLRGIERAWSPTPRGRRYRASTAKPVGKGVLTMNQEDLHTILAPVAVELDAMWIAVERRLTHDLASRMPVLRAVAINRAVRLLLGAGCSDAQDAAPAVATKGDEPS